MLIADKWEINETRDIKQANRLQNTLYGNNREGKTSLNINLDGKGYCKNAKNAYMPTMFESEHKTLKKEKNRECSEIYYIYFFKKRAGKKLCDQDIINWSQASGLCNLESTVHLHCKDILIYTWNIFSHLDTGMYCLFTFAMNQLKNAHHCVKLGPRQAPFKLLFVKMECVLEQINIHLQGITYHLKTCNPI